MSRYHRLRALTATIAVAALVAGCTWPLNLKLPPDAANPFGAHAQAAATARHSSYGEVRKLVDERAGDAQTAVQLLFVAELKKRTGDADAAAFYERAIAAGDGDPAYDLFYADYLRIHRGARGPVIREAARRYLAAREKLRRSDRAWDAVTRDRIERGLATLYERDGLPLLPPRGDGSGPPPPVVSFSSRYHRQRDTSPFPEVDDARDFSSEVAFIESPLRLNRQLTDAELRQVLRRRFEEVWTNRIRIDSGVGPVIDVFQSASTADDAAITNFFDPNSLADVDLREYGMRIEWPMLTPDVDFAPHVGYRRVQRKGVIEFFPGQVEEIDVIDAGIAVAGQAGPDRVTLSYDFQAQLIEPDIASPPDRDRFQHAVQLSYLLTRHTFGGGSNTSAFRIDNRGIEFSAGAVFDRESWDDVYTDKRDFFVGVAFNGLELASFVPTIDFQVRPTLFTSSASNDDTQANKQYRTNASLQLRLLDQETEPGLPVSFLAIHPAFLHLVLPFRHDLPIDGPEAFENYRYGAGLAAKWFFDGPRRTSFLASATYEIQEFPKLDERIHTFRAEFGFGF